MSEKKEQIPYRSQCKCYCHATNGPALHFVPCCQPDPTIEEVLVNHYGYVPHEYIMAAALGAMKEWASIETEQLRQENKTLKEQQRTLYVEVNSDSLAAAHYEKEIEQLRQENETLKAMHSAELKMRQEAEETGEGAAKYHSELKLALDQVGKELLRAKTLFPSFFVNQHEAYAVILEEVDELWAEIKKNQRDYDLDAQRKEAVQAAAMLIRLIVELL